MYAALVRPALLRRVTCTNARCISTGAAPWDSHFIRSSRQSVLKLWATDIAHHAPAVRYVSVAAKNKVNERKEAVKRTSPIEDRVKKIVGEQLGVKEDEVCILRITELHVLRYWAGGPRLACTCTLTTWLTVLGGKLRELCGRSWRGQSGYRRTRYGS
jgi:hypothetical protein